MRAVAVDIAPGRQNKQAVVCIPVYILLTLLCGYVQFCLICILVSAGPPIYRASRSRSTCNSSFKHVHVKCIV
jgi:hypothetical protein